MDRPRGGLHYPRSTGEFQAWFGTDADCLDYLEWLRWPGGFVCERCGHAGGWRMSDGGLRCCAGCDARTSVSAGTIFDRTRTPLTVWFTVCWMFAGRKDGVSALSVQRTLEIGSYQTAWAMLHRLRSVLVRPGRDRLAGTVEVDETYIGGEEPGLRGGRARGKKVLTGIAVEVRQPKGIGRCRMAVLADGCGRLAASLRDQLRRAGRESDHRRLDGLPRAGRARLRPPAAQPAGRPRPGKGSGQAAARGAPGRLAGQAVAAEHPPGLGRRGPSAELPGRVVFRLNGAAQSRGLVFYRLLQLAAGHDPVRYRNIVAGKRPRKIPSAPPAERGHPPSLERPPAERPWRAADLGHAG